MRFVVQRQLAKAEVNAALRMNRGRWYMPRRIVGDLHGYAFVYVGLYGIGDMLLNRSQRNQETLLGTVLSILLGAFLLGATELLREYRLRKAMARLNRYRGLATLTEDAISFEGQDGMHRFAWESFERAVLGDEVAVLYMPGRKRRFFLPRKKSKFLVVPLTALSGADRLDIAGVLRGVLGPDRVRIVPHK